jgi:hypothetical protein
LLRSAWKTAAFSGNSQDIPSFQNYLITSLGERSGPMLPTVSLSADLGFKSRPADRLF